MMAPNDWPLSKSRWADHGRKRSTVNKRLLVHDTAFATHRQRSPNAARAFHVGLDQKTWQLKGSIH